MRYAETWHHKAADSKLPSCAAYSLAQGEADLPHEPKERRPGRPRVANRAVLKDIRYVLWTGCQWKAVHHQRGAPLAIEIMGANQHDKWSVASLVGNASPSVLHTQSQWRL
jgi:hypothetical protein